MTSAGNLRHRPVCLKLKVKRKLNQEDMCQLILRGARCTCSSSDWRLLLLHCLLCGCCVCCSLAISVDDGAQTPSCSPMIPHEIEIGLEDSLHRTDCRQMAASLYSYSVQAAAAADSLQSSEFSDRGGGLTGSFELEHSLTPADILLIVLGEAMDSFGASKHGCHRLAVCNQSADGLRQRLRLSVSLRPSMSYTMKIFKLANGSSLCEPPRVRFFITRSSAAERPLLQLAVRRCGGCESRGADFRCSMDAYLLADWLREQVQLRVMEPSSGAEFYDVRLTRNDSWAKQPVEVRIQSKGILLQIDLYVNSRLIRWARRNFHAIRSEGASPEKQLQPQICNLTTAGLNFSRCPAKVLATDDTKAENLALILALILALTLALYLTLLVALAVRHRIRQSSSRRRLIVLVLPDGADSRRAVTVRRLQRELTSAGGVDVHKIAGLRCLTRQLVVRSSSPIVFISWDAAFTSFQDNNLPDDASRILRTLLQVEKHRVRGFYTESEAIDQPSLANSIWTGLEVRKLGEDKASVRDSAHSLLADLHLSANTYTPCEVGLGEQNQHLLGSHHEGWCQTAI